MTKVNLLKSSILSAQGNLEQTVQAIKNNTINVSSKYIATLEESVETPYFLLEQESKENQIYIYESIKKVVADVAIDLSSEDRAQTALIFGTSMINLHIVDSIKDTQENKPFHSSNIKRSIDSYAKDLANEFGFNDYTMTITTACTSSVNALSQAKNLLDADVFKYAIVVGVEIFSQMMSSGFSSMKLLSQNLQKPFDTSRDGLVLGEGLASILLGKDESPWSLVAGYSNCDASTVTSVSESGDEFTKVIKNTLRISGLESKDITALKAHATSTQANDIAELNAIHSVFDESLTFTVIKPYLGHTLGACGALELAVFMGCIDKGFIPKTINHTDSIDKNYVPLLNHKECDSGVFMLNYFGFGGNNASLIIKKESL